jgi:tetratricopeptide (TPR) repeat protein
VICRLDRLLALLALGLTLCAVAPATAQRARRAPPASPSVTQARALFAEGVAHVEARRFAEAETSFRAALALRDAPTIRYNLASVLFEQGRYPESNAEIDVVLADQAAPAEVRAHASDLRRQLLAQAGFARVTLVGITEVSVAIDGFRLTDPSGEVALSPGTHTAVATRDALELGRDSLELRTGQHATFTLGAPVPEPVEPTPDAALVADDGSRPLVEEWWFWTAIGGGVVLSAVLIGVAASSGGVEEPIPGNFQPGIVRW